MDTEHQLQTKYKTLKPFMDERTWRLTLAADARSMGHGGISRVANAAGVSRMTIYAGIRELKEANQNDTVKYTDRDRQFQFINASAIEFLRRRDPVISVDTKKKELVGIW